MSVGIWLLLLGTVVGLIVGRRCRDDHTIQQALAASDIETDDDRILQGLTEGALTVEDLQELGLDPQPYLKRQRALEGVRRLGKAVRKAGITLTVERGSAVMITGDLRNVDIKVRKRLEDAQAGSPPAPPRTDPGVEVVAQAE